MMKCQRCNLPMFDGGAGFAGPQCKCWWTTPPAPHASVPLSPGYAGTVIPQFELAALRKDAERYRWLRDKAPGEIVFDHTESQYEGGSHFLLRIPFDGEPVHNDAHSAMKMDAAIDAALAVGAA
jgi:hypothetical protein